MQCVPENIVNKWVISDNRDDTFDVVSDQDLPSWWYLDKEKMKV